MGKYIIEYTDIVVRDHIPKLGKSVKTLIKNAIEKKLTSDPIEFGKPLQYSLKGHRRLRVGDYWVVYRIDIARFAVIIVAIKHRKEIYK